MAKKEPIRFEDFFPSAPEMAAHRDKPKKARLSLDDWNSILDDYEPMSPEAQMRQMTAEAARNKKS